MQFEIRIKLDGEHEREAAEELLCVLEHFRTKQHGSPIDAVVAELSKIRIELSHIARELHHPPVVQPKIASATWRVGKPQTEN